jgi:hypothetical protein
MGIREPFLPTLKDWKRNGRKPFRHSYLRHGEEEAIEEKAIEEKVSMDWTGSELGKWSNLPAV